jgi:hypothetical protein
MKNLILVLFAFISIGLFGQTKETEPDYLLRLHGPWQTYESKNFRFYYRDNPKISKNLTDSDLELIAKAQQVNFYRIGDILSIQHERLDTLRKINVWMFQDLNEKTEITKIHATDFCIPPYWSIYCTYASSKAAHELGHMIIDEYWGYFKSKKYNFVIEEGFASLVDEGHGKRNFDYFKKSKKIIQNKKYSMPNVINNANVTGIFKNPYTQKAIVVGGFVKYLIKEHGIDKFKNLWLNLSDDGEAFSLVYNKSIDDLANDYMDFLSDF